MFLITLTFDLPLTRCHSKSRRGGEERRGYCDSDGAGNLVPRPAAIIIIRNCEKSSKYSYGGGLKSFLMLYVADSASQTPRRLPHRAEPGKRQWQSPPSKRKIEGAHSEQQIYNNNNNNIY